MESLNIYPLRSGSSGNAIIISDKKTTVLVDCGISGRMASESLCEIGIVPDKIDALLVTHEHLDHIKGVGIFSRRYNVPIYANAKTWEAMKAYIGQIPDNNIKVFNSQKPFMVKDLSISAFCTPHDAANSVGYFFENNINKVAIATDLGEINSDILNALNSSTSVLLEANYDLNMLEIGPYPPELKRRIKSNLVHLCNDEAGKMAVALAKSGTHKIILGHLSQENNHPYLAYQTVKNYCEESGIFVGNDIFLSVAHRNAVGFISPEESWQGEKIFQV